MDAAVVVFPGSNREHDVATALGHAMGKPPRMVWHRDSELPKVDLIVVPGGFSYGDYLRCGAIAAHSPVMREVKERAKAGVAVLGICNGFQILTEAGLLPGILLRNAGLGFVCKNVGPQGRDEPEPVHVGLFRRPDPLDPRRPSRRQLLRRSGDPGPARGARPDRLPLLRRGRRAEARGQSQRLGPPYRRHLQREQECAGLDAAS